MNGPGIISPPPILVGDMKRRLLQRLEHGPAMMVDLVAIAYAGQAAPRHAVSSISVALHRLAERGFPIYKALGNGSYHLAPGGPAYAAIPALPGRGASHEAGVPRETLPALGRGIGSEQLVARILARDARP